MTTIKFTQGAYSPGPTGPTGAASIVTGPTGPSFYEVQTSAQTASYTLALNDANKIVEVSSTSATTVSIPANSSVAFPVGTQIHVLQTNTGQVTIAAVASSGVTVNGSPGLKLSGQWRMATLIKRATDTWVAVGSLTA